MCNDVPSNWLLGICSKHCCSIYLGYHLVGNHYCHTKLSQERHKINCFFARIGKSPRWAVIIYLVNTITFISMTTWRILQMEQNKRIKCSQISLPHLQVEEACAEIWPNASAWLTIHLGQNNLSGKELWRCPRSAKRI